VAAQSNIKDASGDTKNGQGGQTTGGDNSNNGNAGGTSNTGSNSQSQSQSQQQKSLQAASTQVQNANKALAATGTTPGQGGPTGNVPATASNNPLVDVLSRQVLRLKIPPGVLPTDIFDADPSKTKTYVEVYVATPNGISNRLIIPYRSKSAAANGVTGSPQQNAASSPQATMGTSPQSTQQQPKDKAPQPAQAPSSEAAPPLPSPTQGPGAFRGKYPAGRPIAATSPKPSASRGAGMDDHPPLPSSPSPFRVQAARPRESASAPTYQK